MEFIKEKIEKLHDMVKKQERDCWVMLKFCEEDGDKENQNLWRARWAAYDYVMTLLEDSISDSQ